MMEEEVDVMTIEEENDNRPLPAGKDNTVSDDNRLPPAVGDNTTVSNDDRPLPAGKNYTVTDDDQPLLAGKNYTVTDDDQPLLAGKSYTVSDDDQPLPAGKNYTVTDDDQPLPAGKNYTVTDDDQPLPDERDNSTLSDDADIFDFMNIACERLRQANHEYLLLVSGRKNNPRKGLHLTSPKGSTFLKSRSANLLEEFLIHCYGRMESEEVRDPLDEYVNHLNQTSDEKEPTTSEVTEVKVTDENFTKVKRKSPRREKQTNTRRVSMRLVKKKQDSGTIDREEEDEQINGGEGGDYVDEDSNDEDDDDDEDWQPNGEDVENNMDDESMEPKAKKRDVEFDSDEMSTENTSDVKSVNDAVSNISAKSVDDHSTNQKSRSRKRTATSSKKSAPKSKSKRLANRKTEDKKLGKGSRKIEGKATGQNAETRGGKRNKQCSGCRQGFASVLELRLHQKSTACLKKKFFCDLCSASFVTESGLLKHERRTHTVDNEVKKKNISKEIEKFHVCVQCNEEFPTKEVLAKHQKKHNQTLHACRKCKELFPDQETYEEHKKKHAEEEEEEEEEVRNEACVNCEKPIVGEELLETYSMLCEECCNNPFSCKQCQQRYKMFYILAMHDCRKSYVKNMEEILAVDFENHQDSLPCNICQKNFKNRKNLCAHYKTHYSDTRFQCNICWKYYKDSSKLKKHKRLVHSENRKYKCTVCGKTYKENEELLKHMRICYRIDDNGSDSESFGEPQSQDRKSSASQEILCKACFRNFHSERSYLRHRCDGLGKDGNSNDGEVQSNATPCRNCGRSTKDSTDDLLCRQCSGNKFMCDKCQQAYSMFYLLALHDCEKTFKENLQWIRDTDFSSPNQELLCHLCNKTYSNKKNLCSHYKIHFANERIQCDMCGQTFKHQNSLHKHKRFVHTDTRDYICDICGKAFKQSDTLNTHRRLHTHEKTKDYQCQVCGKYLSGGTALSVHMNLHSGALPYVCEFCGRAFRQYGNLQKHKITHGAYKIYQCHVCQKSFKHCETYKIHMKGHVLDGTLSDNKYGKIYTCSYCDKKMPSASQYTVHLRTHTNERPFKCQLCCKAFKEHGKLKRHMKTHIQEPSTKRRTSASAPASTSYEVERDQGYPPNGGHGGPILETMTVSFTSVPEDQPMPQGIAIPITEGAISYPPGQMSHFTEQGDVIRFDDKYTRERYLPLE